VVQPVVEREVAAERLFVGAVQPVRSSTVSTEVPGLVVKYLISAGDRVEAGRPLAKLRAKPLEIALNAARADLDLRAQELAELEHGSRPEEIAEAKAKVDQARAEAAFRGWKRDSARDLYQSKTISQDELKEAERNALTAKAQLAQAEAAAKQIIAGPRAEKIAQAKARYDSQAAEVARLQDEVEHLTIKAPFSGYVTAEHTQVGEWLTKGQAVAEVAELDRVDITFPVLEDFVTGLKKGMPVRITIDALKGREFTGALQAIVPQADVRARTFPVKIRVQNEHPGASVLLKAGMFARVHMPVGAKRKALLVPKDAIVLGNPRGPLVYLAGPDSTARPAYVKLGIAVEGLVAVTGALKAGDSVVVLGNERVRPGAKLILDRAK